MPTPLDDETNVALRLVENPLRRIQSHGGTESAAQLAAQLRAWFDAETLRWLWRGNGR